MIGAWRIGLAIVAAWLLAIPAGVAEEASNSVAGKLLVATEQMPDPRFAETVIYMVGHDAEGAMGVVINLALETMAVADILRGFGEDASGAEGERRILAGGPVFPDRGFVLHSADYGGEATITVDGEFAFTPGIGALRDTVEGSGPARALVFLGISSWGPGQLEGELLRAGWAVVPADPEIVFDDDLDSKWQRALSRRGIDL
jgi:putative transcriptional regulator